MCALHYIIPIQALFYQQSSYFKGTIREITNQHKKGTRFQPSKETVFTQCLK